MHALRWIQEQHGYIDPNLYADIADVFNLSIAEVRGVVSFYHDFRSRPPPRHSIRVCQAEACQALGARQLTREFEQKLGCKLNEVLMDNSIELKPVYCLGLCALGPSIEIDGEIYARGTLELLDLLKL